MEKALLNLIAGERRLPRQGYELRLLSAWELLQAQQEASDMDGEPETLGLRRNACLLSRAAVMGSSRLFLSGRAVMEAWSAEQIREEIQAYRHLASREGPDCGDKKAAEVLLEQLRQESMERVRWKVLKTFGVLPSETRAREMTEGDYLYCALQLVLDREETLEKLCPACRSRVEEERCVGCGERLVRELETNPQFDLKRFEELSANG